MYVGPETGTREYEDECFEVQRQENEEWIHEAYTSYYGDHLKESELEKAPSGWEFEGRWEVDLHCEGGADGWIYSLDVKFSEKSGGCDICERIGHKFRRRRLKRFRTLKNTSALWTLYEDADIFKKRCDEFGWEYAQKFDKPLHMQQQRGDHFRRKRMLREIIQERNSA
uniref:Peroxin/Ferlin domain-containing protein n=1 Tax=Panagrolaimus sp. ES5 TaxID=591445 RepID=A0AC34GE76_9BILA